MSHASRYALVLLLAWAGIAPAQNPKEVLTQHNDNQRTGAYSVEAGLNPSNVRPATFGKLNIVINNIDGQVYAQPLYAQGVQRPEGAKNAIFIATENNQLYALDADTGTQLWRTGPEKLGAPVDAPKNNQGNPCRDIRSKIGITSTPVIDPVAGPNRMIYVVVKTADQNGPLHKLFAVNVNTGAIARSLKITSALPFKANTQLNRPGLLLLNGALYIAFGAHCDYQPYHGFVFAYRAADFKPIGVYCSTCDKPQSNAGGIWHAGNGLASDDQGRVYLMTGNGSNGGADLSDSFVRLASQNGSLRATASFTPPNPKFLTECDLDLGSSGPLLLPGNLLIGGGKEGTFYLLGQGDLALKQKFQGTFDQYEGPVQDPQGQCLTNGDLLSHVQGSRPHIHGSPVLWKDAHPGESRIFVWGEKDFLRSYALRNGTFNTQPISQSGEKLQNGSMPGAILSLSSSGTANAILWAVHPIASCADRVAPADANEGPQPGVLMAFDADNLQNVLWDSCMNEARDGFGTNGKIAKFVPPTIANGKVYMAVWDVPNPNGDVVKGRVLVYGALQH